MTTNENTLVLQGYFLWDGLEGSVLWYTFTMKFTADEISIIKGAYREVFSGMGLQDLGYSESDVKRLLGLLENGKELTCAEIKLLRNLLTDLLKELDDFEFQTRMGFCLDEVFVLFKKVKKEIDKVCY